MLSELYDSTYITFLIRKTTTVRNQTPAVARSVGESVTTNRWQGQLFVGRGARTVQYLDLGY